MADYLSEAVTGRAAIESTRGTSPSSGWQQLQVDVGGVSGFRRNYTDVERDIHSVNATMEKGDHVAYTVEPSLTHDVNKDFVDTFAEPVYRCAAKHLGGTGLSKFRPTAVADGGGAEDSYTVASLGAIPNNVLIYARGFTNSANNGLKITTGTSTGTAIKVATGTLVAETPPANATVDVVGVQGAAGDLELSASGHLTSTSLDFTTLGLVVGMWLYLPTAAQATAMGDALYAFSVAAYAGRARITAISANQLTLERHTWTLGSGTTESTSTVRVFLSSRFYRNYPIDDTTNYAEKTVSMELEDIKPGVGADSRYTYVKGCGANTLQLGAPINSKITATLGFVGMTATVPVAVASRQSGASTAYAPLAEALVDTQNDLREVRLTDSGGSLIADVTDWTLNITNNIKPRNSQGTFGASGLNYGKFNYAVNMTAYYQDSDIFNAADENRTGLAWDVFVGNHQYGFVVDLPNVALRNPDNAYAGNEPVMTSCDIVAFRSLVDGIAGSLSVFGYLPERA